MFNFANSDVEGVAQLTKDKVHDIRSDQSLISGTIAHFVPRMITVKFSTIYTLNFLN